MTKSQFKYCRIVTNIAVAVFAAIGIILNYTLESNTVGLFYYFTTQSNIWIGAICVVWVVFDFLGKEPNKALHIIKFSLTVCITLTGLVYNFILAPQAAMIFGSILRAYSWSVSILHIVVPVLAVVSYLAFDKQVLNIKWVFSGVVMPLLYCVFIFILVAASDTPHFWGMDHQPSKVPYFFLDFENNGWFTVNQGIWKLGTFWWLLIAVVLVLCISFLLHFLHKLCHINKLEQEKINND